MLQEGRSSSPPGRGTRSCNGIDPRAWLGRRSDTAKVGSSTLPRPTFNPYYIAVLRSLRAMNRGVVYLGAFMVLVGFLFGFYLLSFIGLFLLIPGLLSSSRPPLSRVPPTPPPKEDSWRIIPKAPTKEPTASSSSQPMGMAAPGQPSPSASALAQGYTPALFPMPMLPSLSLMGSLPQASSEQPAKKQGGQDELIEVGAILAMLKLVFG